MVYWIINVVAISASARIKSSLANAISFPGIVQAYAHSLILIPLSLRYFRIRFRAEALGFKRENQYKFDGFLTWFWHSDDWGLRGLLVLVILAYVACNAFLAVAYVIPRYSGVPGWISLVIRGTIVPVATTYHFSFFGSLLPDPGVEVKNDARDRPERTQVSWD